MHDHEIDKRLMELRESYNRPPETPREEMWDAIQGRLGGVDRDVVSLEVARQTRRARLRNPFGWAAAAAAVLILGLGLGRMTAPGTAPETELAEEARPNAEVFQVAALEHLVRTESLLTLVRADARAGRMEPALGTWARGLLTQTRLLMDAQNGADPVMRELLEDLELVLIQIVGVANTPAADAGKARSELNLALDGLEKREVLPRIQAVVPSGPRFVGT